VAGKFREIRTVLGDVLRVEAFYGEHLAPRVFVRGRDFVGVPLDEIELSREDVEEIGAFLRELDATWGTRPRPSCARSARP
jgi:hypothetical protein